MPYSHLVLEKIHFPTSGTVLCSPTRAAETKCPARRNKSQVSAKVMIALPVMDSSKSENKRADELHTGNTKHTFIPIKTRKHIPQMPWLASVICGTSPQHSGFGWVASRPVYFQGYPSCPPHCWPSQLCLAKHFALFLTGNYQGFLQSNHLISQQFLAMIGQRLPVLISNHGPKMKAQQAPSKSLAPAFTWHRQSCGAVQWNRSGNQSGLKLFQQREKEGQEKRVCIQPDPLPGSCSLHGETDTGASRRLGQHWHLVYSANCTPSHHLCPTTARNSQQKSGICPAMPPLGHNPGQNQVSLLNLSLQSVFFHSF